VARYVLNTAVITEPGDYSYRYLSVGEAREWLAFAPYTSAMRYDATAEAMKRLLGERPPVTRRYVVMMPGDEALVFRLRMAGDMTVENLAKVKTLTPDLIAKRCEIGLLTKAN
jgi:hypothetical protein